MRPWFQTADSNSPSSNSDPTDRRINALVRHLVESSSSAMADSLSASPTSSLHTDSVFAHVVRAPEDPILGVISLFRSICWFFHSLLCSSICFPLAFLCSVADKFRGFRFRFFVLFSSCQFSDFDLSVSIIWYIMEMNDVELLDHRDREFFVGWLWIVIVTACFS